MKITYNDILNHMKKAFFDECGYNPDNLSDVGARLSVFASELYSLYCNIDYVKRQSFVQTASGEYLDYHAQLRDMTRKTASKAKGVLTFSITEPIDDDILIESGTICAIKDKPFIQFLTDEDATLSAGELSVDVSATALEPGRDYNAKIGEITVLVKAPPRIEKVVNKAKFTGGNNAECDEALRNRIINSFKYLPSGYSLEYMEESIESIDEVLDCKIYNYDWNIGGNIEIYIRTSDDMISDELRRKVRDKTIYLELINEVADIRNSVCNEIELTVVIKKDCDHGVISELCWEYVNCIEIGNSLVISDMEKWIEKRADIGKCEILCNGANGNCVVNDKGEYFWIRSIDVLNE